MNLSAQHQITGWMHITASATSPFLLYEKKTKKTNKTKKKEKNTKFNNKSSSLPNTLWNNSFSTYLFISLHFYSSLCSHLRQSFVLICANTQTQQRVWCRWLTSKFAAVHIECFSLFLQKQIQMICSSRQPHSHLYFRFSQIWFQLS